MIIASRTQFHVERPWGQRPFSINVLNVKAVLAAFNKEKALVGAFSVITNLRMELFEALADTRCMQCIAVCTRKRNVADNGHKSVNAPLAFLIFGNWCNWV